MVSIFSRFFFKIIQEKIYIVVLIYIFEKMVREKLFLIAFVVLFSISFIFAVHTTSISQSNFNNGTYYIFNITLNNTNLGQQIGNITEVNISFPSQAGFSFINGSNGTNRLGFFSNTTYVLSWFNNTNYLINGTINNSNFWINASASSIGRYNITVISLNGTGTTSQTNVSVRIQDSIAPVITLISPVNGNNTITPGNVTFVFNVSDSSSDSITNCSLILNGAVVSINASVNATGANNFFVNTSYVIENTWSVNCTDSDNNRGNSSTRTFSLSSFEFNGTIKDSGGNPANNTLVNVTVSSMGAGGPPTVIGYYSTTSNASGWFNLSLPSDSSWMYKPVIRHTNATTNAIDFVGPTVPDFPYQEFSALSRVNFYLKQAGTINITAINATANRVSFNYQVKDTKLGYPVAHEWTSTVSEAIVYVPADRNYSVMIYPSQSLPVSYNWNNFSSTSDYNINSISSYNATTKTVRKMFNTSNNLIRLNGYINATGINGWDEFKVAALLLEPGNMIYLQYGALPYNMSAWNNGQTDVYNLTSGFYNITVPGPAENQTILLFASAKNGSVYYGGFKNITISYGSGNNQYNFSNDSMLTMLGNPSNLTINLPTSQGTFNISCKRQTFNILNSTNGSFSGTAHIEAKVDYSSYGAMEFTFMEDVAQGVGSFSIPLLNVSGGVKEFNVFVAQGAPKRLSKTSSQIVSNNNITISSFDPGDIGGALANNQITVAMYISNSSCDVPNPASSCLVTSSSNLDTFNPLSAVIGGGAISFRMGTSSGIFIHYVNVDLLASGPPDGLFENEAGSSESSSSFSNAMKFGSGGPTMYDYILISMPYVEGSVNVTGLNENSDVNLSIPTFYGQDANGNMDWATPIWSSSNGTNASNFAGNFSHYSANQNDWQILMQSKNCTTNDSAFNASNPCFINKTGNRIWVRIPHFSGTAPSVSGSLITATSTTTTTTSSGGGSFINANAFWSLTHLTNENEFKQGFTKELKVKERVKILIDKKEHFVGVISVGSNSAVINVSSTPQQANLEVGKEKKFDVNNDNYYDLSVGLNSIVVKNGVNKASISVKSIYEKIIIEQEPQKDIVSDIKESIDDFMDSNTGKSGGIWIAVIIVILIGIAIVIYFLFFKKSKKEKYVVFKKRG